MVYNGPKEAVSTVCSILSTLRCPYPAWLDSKNADTIVRVVFPLLFVLALVKLSRSIHGKIVSERPQNIPDVVLTRFDPKGMIFEIKNEGEGYARNISAWALVRKYSNTDLVLTFDDVDILPERESTTLRLHNNFPAHTQHILVQMQFSEEWREFRITYRNNQGAHFVSDFLLRLSGAVAEVKTIGTGIRYSFWRRWRDRKNAGLKMVINKPKDTRADEPKEIVPTMTKEEKIALGKKRYGSDK